VTFLDLEIAKEVFGWRILEGDAIPDFIVGKDLGERAHRKRVWVKSGPDDALLLQACEECGNFPQWSSDIAAAWHVVEQVQRLHPGWRPWWR
jgi:hypothetical protein